MIFLTLRLRKRVTQGKLAGDLGAGAEEQGIDMVVSADSLGVALKTVEQAVCVNSVSGELAESRLRQARSDLPPPVLEAIISATREALKPLEETRLGRFIVLTGLDKAGKETQCFNPSRLAGVKSVRDFLEERGFKVLAVNLPSYDTLLGSFVGAYLGTAHIAWPVGIEGDLPTDLAWILWSLDRAQHNGRVGRWLAQSRWNVVLAKRWTESHIAYQAALGVEERRILRFERNIAQPDYTLVLDISARETIERSARLGRDVDRYEQASFLAKVRENYLQLAAKRVGGMLRIIDGHGSPQEVNANVLSTLVELGF